MPKNSLNDIFKNGDKFKLKQIDFTDPKVRAEFAEVKKQQEDSLRRKDVDWVKLNQFYITI